MNYKIMLIVCCIGLLVSPAMGDAPPWDTTSPASPTYKITIDGPTHAAKGTWVTIDGRFTELDGSHMTKHHTGVMFVNVYIDNGDGFKKTDGYMFPDGKYYMYGKYKITSSQRTSFYTSYTDPNTHVTTTSNIHFVNPAMEVESSRPLLKFVGYAKGFFALVWFCSLFVAIGMGSLAAQCHDPEKKQKYTSALFDLVKILFTVTIFYMATLFLMGS